MRSNTMRPLLVALAAFTALSTLPVPAAADPPGGSTIPAPPPAPSAGPVVARKTVALGAAGVAVAGAVGAVVFGVLALHEKSAFEAAPTDANAGRGNDFAAYTDGCIALAAAAGITSLVLYLTSGDAADAGTTPKRPAISASPIVIAHGGGAGAVLRF